MAAVGAARQTSSKSLAGTATDRRESGTKIVADARIMPLVRSIALRLRAAALGLILADVHGAAAASLDDIFGKWIEKFPNGNGMVTEFTATMVSSYPADAAGQALPGTTKHDLEVRYRDLGRNEKLGETVAVESASEKGGFLVIVKDHDHALMDFPGMGAHFLVRLQP